MSIHENTSDEKVNANTTTSLVGTEEKPPVIESDHKTQDTVDNEEGDGQANQNSNSEDGIKDNTDESSVLDPDKQTKDSTLKASLARFSNSGGIRLFLFGGFFVFCIVLYTGYSIFFSDPEIAEEESGEFVVPKTNIKAAPSVNAEQAEYIKNQQQLDAEAAVQKDGSYIASFLDQRTEENVDSYGEPTQPGAAEQQEVGRTQFFDSQGRAYSLDQALALSQEGKNIPGVTVGEGSVNDPNVASKLDVNSNKVTQPASSMAVNSTKPTFESYIVQPYSAKKTGLNDSATKQVESLTKSAQQTEQWTQDYLMLRQKKAQLIDSKTQLAFEDQLRPLIETVKSKKDDKNGGKYTRNQYATPIRNSDSNSIPKPPAASNPKQEPEEKVLVRAGQTYRATLASTVNTDEGTEVLAKIQSGPLKGETILGTVKITEQNMQFIFTKVLRRNKPELALNAVARQIGTNSLGMADDIKNHTLQRYTSLVVSSALSGVGNAYEQTSGTNAVVENGTVVTNSTDPSSKRIIGNAVGELGQQLSSDIKDMSKRKPTYIAMNGKVFNLFLNQDVIESSSDSIK